MNENKGEDLASKKQWNLKAGSQELISREKITEVVKELLQGCGAIPKKLGRIKLPFVASSVKPKVHSQTKPYPHFGQNSSIGCSTFASVTKLKHPLPTPRKLIKNNLLKRCSRINLSINRDGINKIICNFPSHIVAVFKEYLIYDDANEFLYRFYKEYEGQIRLSKIIKTCNEKWMPSYMMLRVSKIFYKKEKRRAKIILMKRAEELDCESNESSLFDTKFMNSLAKDDVENSHSKLLLSEYSLASEKGFSQLFHELSQLVSRKSSIRQQEPKESELTGKEILMYQSYPKQRQHKHLETEGNSLESSKVTSNKQFLRKNLSAFKTNRLRSCYSLPKIRIALGSKINSGQIVIRNRKGDGYVQKNTKVRFSSGVKNQGQICIVKSSSRGVLKK